MNRIEIKQRAKVALGNNIFGETWLLLLLVVVIGSALITAAGYVAAGIGSLLIAGPIGYGLSYIFLKKIRTEEKVDIADIFKGFTENFGQNFLLALLSGIFVMLWSLLFVIPGIVKTYAYSMAFYIRVDHPEYDWRQCLQESMRMTNGHKGDLFILDLSFIGWYFVGSLCLGVGALWVYPYHLTTKAMYYEILKQNIDQ